MLDQASQCEATAYSADYDALYRSSFGPGPARQTHMNANASTDADVQTERPERRKFRESREAPSAAARNSALAQTGASEDEQYEPSYTEHANSAFVVKRRRYPERVHPDYRRWLPQTVYERDLVADQTVRGLRQDPPGLSVIRDPSQYDRERERDRTIRGVPGGTIPNERFRVEVVRGSRAESG